jgi:hypothetical protein
MTWAEIARAAAMATEPCRELDSEVALAAGHKIEWKQANYTMDTYPVISWNAPHPYKGMREPCPLFTGSTDAITTLIVGHLPGTLVKIVRNRNGSGCVELEGPEFDERSDDHHAADGRCPSLAAVAAFALAMASAAPDPTRST